MKTFSVESPINTPPKILIMGPPGSRKTWLALQFPDTHILDCDRNLRGPVEVLMKGITDLSTGKLILQPLLPNLKFTYDDIRVDDSGNQIAVEECYNRVCDKLRLFKSDPNYKSRRVVVLDSLSHVNEFIIRHTLQLQRKKERTYEMETRDWNPFKSHAYALLVGRLEETGKPVICTCHETKVYEKGSVDTIMQPTVKEYEPYFQGQIGDTIGAFFTDIWRMEVRRGAANTTSTILLCQRHPQCSFIKNSFGMPAEIDVTGGYSAIEPYIKSKI